MPLYRVDSDDLDFIPEVEAAMRRSGGRFAYLLSLFILAFLVIFVVWARWAMLDEVTRGVGQIIPSSRIKVIQNLEGGILEELLVHEGDIVDQGDLLVRIDNTAAEATYRDGRSKYLSILANLVRLEAAIEDKEMVFPDEIRAEAPTIIDNQRSIHAAHQKQLAIQTSVLEEQAQQREQEIAEMQSQQQRYERNLILSKEQLRIAAPLIEKDLMPRLEQLGIERELSNAEGDLRTVKLSIQRAHAALREAKQRVEELKASFKANELEQANKLRDELKSLAQAVIAGKDKVMRTDVRSPVRGVIKDIKKNTIGGVIQPGEDILEIVPLNDNLLVEAHIRPADIAFLRPGQSAVVKITAYDFTIYGGLKGKLEGISADAIKDEKGENYFRVRVRTEQNKLVHASEEFPIIPGMVANIEILTGKKSVFDYLVKPIIKARELALKER